MVNPERPPLSALSQSVSFLSFLDSLVVDSLSTEANTLYKSDVTKASPRMGNLLRLSFEVDVD